MKYGVTGVSRKLTDAELLYLAQAVEALDDVESAYSGGAFGVDTEFIKLVSVLWPDAACELVLPAAWHNTGLIPYADSVAYAPKKRDASSTYMARNDLLCDKLALPPRGELLAFPDTRVEVRRGGPSAGTWATVRRARKRGVPVSIFPLDEANTDA